MKKILVLVLGLAVLFAFSASAFTISPKISYVGYLGIGCEFAPIAQLTPDIHLMGEVDWDFWAWSGSSGYGYGELNAVYTAKPFPWGPDKSMLEPYVGAGLIFGFPMGSAWYGGSFAGGIGFGIFGGVTGEYGGYTWFSQLKYASAPITWKYSYTDPWWGTITYEETVNALGAGFEFGIRLPM